MDEISLKILNATEKRNRLKQELEEVEVYISYLKQQRQQQQQEKTDR